MAKMPIVQPCGCGTIAVAARICRFLYHRCRLLSNSIKAFPAHNTHGVAVTHTAGRHDKQ
jgi:hypothetical protein